jgi:Kef-type K+ transport system membrane component KefB
MGLLILVLLVLAAAFGVLGAVLKATVFLVLTVLLTVSVLAVVGWYALRWQVRRVTRDLVGRRDERDLPPPVDDRY